MPSHISFKDLNGRYIELNENEIKEIGLKKSEILYKTPEELFDANIAKEIRQLEARITSYNVCYTKLLRKLFHYADVATNNIQKFL